MNIKTLSKYEQVKNSLRKRITQGKFSPGSKIPIEPELCKMFNVSRITVREAVSSLVHEGLLDRMQGKGTFVKKISRRESDKALIGFFFSKYGNIEDAYHFQTYMGVCKKAKEKGYAVVFEEQTDESLPECQNFTGMIISSTLSASNIKKISSTNIPCVLYGRETSDENIFTVCPDFYNGAIEAVDYLCGLGYENIILINQREEENKRHIHWYNGYLKGLEKNGLKFSGEMVWNYEDFDEKIDTFISGKNLKMLKAVRTALFIPNDATAVELMGRMIKKGIKIPDDLGVIGYYDREVAKFSTPRLTTIGFDKEHFGEKIAETLIDIINGKNVRKNSYVPTYLVERDSLIRYNR